MRFHLVNWFGDTGQFARPIRAVSQFPVLERIARMTIARPQFLWTMALGLIAGGFSTTFAFADPDHAHAESKAKDSSPKSGELGYLCPMLCAPLEAKPGRCPICEMELVPTDATKAEKEISKALEALEPADRKQAVAQRFCPIMLHTRLGATGTPHKVMIADTPVLVCCKGCIKDAEADGKKTLIMMKKLAKASAAMAKMTPKDRFAAEAQKYCAVANKNFLGSMGAPIKLELNGKPVFLCCKGCVKKAKANPDAMLAKVEALKKAGEDDGHDHAEGSGHKQSGVRKHSDGHKH